MTLSTEKIDKFLTGKADLRRCERSRHTHYKLILKSGVCPLPFIVALSRGGGDLPPVAIHGIARALGIRKDELIISERCNISGVCLHIAVVVLLIKRSIDEPHLFDPIVIAESVALMTDDILKSMGKAKNCRIDEINLLRRLGSEIGKTTRYPVLDSCWNRIWQNVEKWIGRL